MDLQLHVNARLLMYSSLGLASHPRTVSAVRWYYARMKDFNLKFKFSEIFDIARYMKQRNEDQITP
eukprot:scaffold18112_cov168-Amphora_coffeaeformis.AAC.1